MNEIQVREKIKEIEVALGGKLSEDYKKFASKVVPGDDVYELKLVSGGGKYIFMVVQNCSIEMQRMKCRYMSLITFLSAKMEIWDFFKLKRRK